jgi:hypothetical protein
MRVWWNWEAGVGFRRAEAWLRLSIWIVRFQSETKVRPSWDAFREIQGGWAHNHSLLTYLLTRR